MKGRLLTLCSGVAALATGSLPGCSDERSCEETLTCPGSSGARAGAAGSGGAGGDAGAPERGGSSGVGAGGASGGRSGGAGGKGAAGGKAGSSNPPAGEGGMAGEGGGGEPEIACRMDSDCEDGLACNGIATCEGGACVAGTPFCASEQEQGCTVTCTEGSGGPVCEKVAEDGDGDDHAPVGNTCSVADKPADDCDDGDDGVYEGAPDTCDGVDSDCDGLEDIDEVGALSGTVVRIGPEPNATYDSAVAWSEELGAFGVYSFRSSAGTSQRAFFTVNPNGTASAPVLGSTNISNDSSLAAGHGGFGLLHTEPPTIDRLAFARIDSSGNIGTPKLVHAGSFPAAALAATPQGWVAAWVESGALLAHRLDPDGAVLNAVRLDVSPDTAGEGKMSLASDGQDVVFAFDADEGVFLRRFTQGLVAVDDPAIELADTGDDPAVGVAPRGYGVAWLAAWPDIVFAEVDRSGAVVCGPVKVGEDSSPRGGSMAVRADGSGWLVAHAENANYRVMLRRIGPACTPVSPELVVDDSTTSYKGSLELAAGSSGFLVKWREPNAIQAFYRAFGANLCD